MIKGKGFTVRDKIEFTPTGILVDGRLLELSNMDSWKHDPLAIALAVVGFGILGLKTGYLIAKLLKGN